MKFSNAADVVTPKVLFLVCILQVLVTLSGCRLANVSEREQAYSRLHGDSGIKGKPYPEIVKDYEKWAQTYSAHTEIIEYGKSVKGTSIIAMKVWRKDLSPAKRPAVIISEGIHGDEYLNITDRLPGEFLPQIADNQTSIAKFLNTGGILYMIPIFNPDGYTARKRENAKGKDLNRDFLIKAVNNDGFTQPETQAVAKFFEDEKLKEKFTLEATMEYHCCVPGLIIPWAAPLPELSQESKAKVLELGTIVKNVFGYPHGSARKIANYSFDPVGCSHDYYFETYGARGSTFEGDNVIEFKKLPDHVNMWNQIFNLVSKDYSSINPTEPKEPTPSNPQSENRDPYVDMYIKVEPASTKSSLVLIGTTPASANLNIKSMKICKGSLGDCKITNAKATVVTGTLTKTEKERNYFTFAPLAVESGQSQTLHLMATVEVKDTAGRLLTQWRTTTVKVSPR